MDRFLYEDKFPTPSDKYQGKWSLDRIIWVCLVLFKKSPNCLSKCLYRFAFSLAVYKSSYCSTSSLAFGFVSILDFGGEMILMVILSHCFGEYKEIQASWMVVYKYISKIYFKQTSSFDLIPFLVMDLKWKFSESVNRSVVSNSLQLHVP